MYLKDSIYLFLINYGKTVFLIPICMSYAFHLLAKVSERRHYPEIGALVLSTAAVSLLGARLFHALIENRDLWKTPSLLFSRFDGMTFNGSLFLGGVFVYFIINKFWPAKKAEYWDEIAKILAFSYGVLRIGCFSNGCCWGKVCALPWSVKFFNSAVMPWLGIPVHPVQLYDSILGFSIFAFLIFLQKRNILKGQLFFMFLLTYGVGRFFTEYFRGDSFRGDAIFLNLSTSQLVSIILIAVAILNFLRPKKIIPALSCLFLVACLPQAPDSTSFKSISNDSTYETYETYKASTEKKNVLFIAADDNLQTSFKPFVESLYGSPGPRIEDLVWWQYSPDVSKIYNFVIRVRIGQVNYQAVQNAIAILESKNEAYDIILMTHGLPNYLSTGKGYFFSFRELSNLKGKLKNLNLVLLQSCFGQSLANDFIQAGAKYVLSYPSYNNNFFFIGIFLHWYQGNTGADAAYWLTKENFSFAMRKSPYLLILHELAKMQNLTEDQYISSLPIPVLDERKE